ncbi:MAG: pitrilysin family protein [Myxococcota bacterium]
MRAICFLNKLWIGLCVCFMVLPLPGCAKHALRHQPAQFNAEVRRDLVSSENVSTFSLPTQHYKLKNGLQVILHHDNRVPYVAVNVWYHVGASNELPHQSGLAHLFEHLMFEGSRNVGQEDYFRLLEAAGATQVNGSTGFSRTNYYEVVPSQELELALWLESDRMGFLLDTLSQDKLDEQRRVVKNERLQRVDNRPYGLAEESAWQSLFGEEHPYYGRVIGSMQALDAATLTDAFDFFQTFYNPSNATLTVAGDFDPETIRKLIKRYFGSLKSADRPNKPLVEVPKLSSEARLYELESLGRLTKVLVHYVTPKLFAAADAECDMISHILTGDRFARLSRALMHDQQLVHSVESYQSSFEHLSVFTVEALVLPGKDPQQDAQAVLDVIDAQIVDLVHRQATAQEIQRAVNVLYTDRLFSLQRLNTRADQLQAYNYYMGTPQGLQADLGRYAQVTPQSMARVVKQYLQPAQRVVLISHVPPIPEQEEQKEPATAL